jgi:hypothetical protein
MAERKQVEDLETRSPLSPVARPVDNYYRPVADTVQLEGGGDFADLAQSVGVAVPQLQKILTEAEKREQEKQIQEGAKARLTNQKSFKQLQQDGQITPGQNPWYWKGFMQQDGRISALNYDEAMRTAYMTSDARNSDDPAALSKFMAEHRQQWLTEHKDATPDWMDTFIPGIQKSENNLSAQHVAHRNEVLVQKQEANHGIEVSKLLRRMTENELFAGNTPEDVEAGRKATAAQIEALTADLVRKGMNGKKANQIIAEQVIAQAVETKDTSLLDILKDVKTPGGSIADITEIRQKVDSAGQHIRTMNRQETQWQWALDDRPDVLESHAWAKETRAKQREAWAKQQTSDDRAERVRGYTSDIVTSIQERGIIDPNTLALLRKDDPGAAMTMEQYQKGFLGRASTVVPDQRVIASMQMRIRSNPGGVTEAEIWAGVGKRWNNDDARAMSDELQQRLTSPAAGVLAKNQSFQTLFRTVGTTVVKNMEASKTGAGEAMSGLAQEEFRDLVEGIYTDNAIPANQKKAKMTEAYLATIKKYNQLATEMMNDMSGNKNTPTTPTKTPDKNTPPGPAKFIPSEHVNQLLSNPRDPELRAEFEKTYGPGSVEKVMSGGAGGRYPIIK